jgi:hypothetical protein
MVTAVESTSFSVNRANASAASQPRCGGVLF